MPKVKVNDIQIYYEVHGKGFPLLMIMGLGANLDWWDPRMIQELSKNFKLVIFDNRGAGRTDISDRKYTVKLFADDTAGLMDALFLKMTEEDWDKVMAVNLKGVFYCTKAALKHMVERKYGKIINLSSMPGVSGNVGQTNYGASKAGVIGLTLCLAREMSKHGINVNSICPGFIDTEMTRAIPEKVRSTMIPFLQYRAINHRLGNPEDVANVAVFLASDESSYITGEVIRVTGGAF